MPMSEEATVSVWVLLGFSGFFFVVGYMVALNMMRTAREEQQQVQQDPDCRLVTERSTGHSDSKMPERDRVLKVFDCNGVIKVEVK